jgi:hypothetical protein
MSMLSHTSSPLMRAAGVSAVGTISLYLRARMHAKSKSQRGD